MLICIDVSKLSKGICHRDYDACSEYSLNGPQAKRLLCIWLISVRMWSPDPWHGILIPLLQSSELLPYLHWAMWNFPGKNCLYSRPRSGRPSNFGTASYLCRPPSVWGSIYSVLRLLFSGWEITVLFLINVIWELRLTGFFFSISLFAYEVGVLSRCECDVYILVWM